MATTTGTITHPESEITEKTARAAHEAVDRFADRAARTEAKIRDTASTSAEKLQEGKQQARERLDSSVKRVDTFVRENPLATAGIAFAAGALISTLLRR